MGIIKYLLNLAGFDQCEVCHKWTMEWQGWAYDTSLCPECYDILVEANQLTRHIRELQ